ncbi:MAG: M15 family metallopeptidase [Calditrichia bacterium]
MSLVEKQWEFLQDVARLLAYASAQGFVVTGGELYRTPEQQRIYLESGRSRTMNSRHLNRLAIDLNFFIREKNGRLRLTYNFNDLEKLGRYWESLNSRNRWGGFYRTFKDVPHFERLP